MIGPAEGEALRRLAQKWRAESAQDAHYPHVPEVMRSMADELDALLTALAPLSGPVDASGEHTCGFQNRVREIPRPDICAECERQTHKDADGFIVAAAAVPSPPAQEPKE